MSNASRWLALSPEKLASENQQKLRGVQLNIFVSPYDVPDAVRGYYDPGLSRFVVEFRYMTEERWSPKAQDRFVTLRIGRESKRLLGIEIDLSGLSAQTVSLRLPVPQLVEEAIERLTKEPHTPSREDNYRIAKDVITSRRKELFDSLAAVT